MDIEKENKCKNCHNTNNIVYGVEIYGSQDDDNPFVKPIETFCWNCFKRPGRHQTLSAWLITEEYGDKNGFRKVFHRITNTPNSFLLFNWMM